MSNNFWEEQEPVSQFELNQSDEQTYGALLQPSQEAVEQIQEEAAYDLDESEVDVVYNARIRLHQAQLYERLIVFDMFADVDGILPQAIDCVRTELKNYIMERLEILLGIRKEKTAKQVVAVEREVVELPFNDEQLNFLTQLADKGLHRVTPVGMGNMPAISLRSLPKETKAKTEVEPLKKVQVPNTTVKTETKKPIQQTSARKPITKPTAPAKKASVKKKDTAHKLINGENSVAPRRLTDSEIDAIAREDLQKLASRKNWEQMTEVERSEELVRINTEHSRPVITDKIPIPTADQLMVTYSTDQAVRAAGNNEIDKINDVISSLLIGKGR